MRRRPFLLFVSALLLLYFPLEWLFRLYSHHSFSWVEAMLFGAIPLFLIGGLLKVNKLGWYTLVAMVALWGIQDLNTYYSTHGHSWKLLSHLGIYIFSLSYFINPRVRHIYFDPKLRWWRQKPRYETHVPTVIQNQSVWDYPVMKNISEGGCFLETKQLFPISDTLSLNILLPVPLTVSVIKVSGEVRWISDSDSKPGMGIQFQNLAAKDASAIQDFLKRGL